MLPLTEAAAPIALAAAPAPSAPPAAAAPVPTDALTSRVAELERRRKRIAAHLAECEKKLLRHRSPSPAPAIAPAQAPAPVPPPAPLAALTPRPAIAQAAEAWASRLEPASGTAEAPRCAPARRDRGPNGDPIAWAEVGCGA